MALLVMKEGLDDHTWDFFCSFGLMHRMRALAFTGVLYPTTLAENMEAI